MSDKIVIKEHFVGSNVTEWISREHGEFLVRVRLRGRSREIFGVIDVEVLRGERVFVSGSFRPDGSLWFGTSIPEGDHWRVATFPGPDALRAFAEAMSIAWDLKEILLKQQQN